MAWSADQTRTMLTVLALYAGNASLATRAIKEEHGWTVKPQTLRKWRTDFADVYDEVRVAAGDHVSKIVSEAVETAQLAAMTERLAIERTHADLEMGECKDPARAARDLSNIKATNIEKFLTLTGRPTTITRVETPAELMAALVGDGVFKVNPAADAQGEAIEDAVVIPGQLLPASTQA